MTFLLITVACFALCGVGDLYTLYRGHHERLSLRGHLDPGVQLHPAAARVATATPQHPTNERHTMSYAKSLHAAAADEALYAALRADGADHEEALAASIDATAEDLDAYGITSETIEAYTDLILDDDRWAEFDDMFDPDDDEVLGALLGIESLWADAFEDEPPF